MIDQQTNPVPPAVETKREQSQIEAIANVPKRVKAFGREYQIKRFSLWQFACSLNYITPLSALLQTLVRSQPARLSQPPLSSAEHDELMNQWLASAPPALRERVDGLLTAGASAAKRADTTEWIPAIVGALSMSGDSMIGLISVATSEPIEWLQEEERDPFEGIELLSVIVEQNLDFFSTENMERLRGIVERLTPKIQELYGAASTTLSEPDTPTT